MLDETTINDTTTDENPKQFPIGIPYVIVNGRVAVDNERRTRVLAGQAVSRHPSDRLGDIRSHCCSPGFIRVS